MKIRTTPAKETEQYIWRLMNYNDAFRKKQKPSLVVEKNNYKTGDPQIN